MGDIRTVETAEVDGEYRVAIAEQKGNDQYEAAVVASAKSVVGRAIAEAFSVDGDGGKWYHFDDAPIVHGEDRSEAIGKAIDAYLNSFEDEDEDADGETVEPTDS